MEVFIFPLLIFSVIHSLAESLPPDILNVEDEVVVETTELFTLTCEGTEPLAWSFQKYSGGCEGYGNKEDAFRRMHGQESAVNSTRPQYKFASQLTLHASEHAHDEQGYYLCHYNDTTNLTDTNAVDRVYVYLFGLDEDFGYIHEHNTVTTKEGESCVLDCRPTKPDLSVTVKHFDQVISSGPLQEPRVGYRLTNLSSNYEEEYTCEIHEEKKTFLLKVERKPPQPPKVDMPDNSYPVKGYDMMFSCKILSRAANHKQPLFRWQLPNRQAEVNESVRSYYNYENKLHYEGLLTVKNASLEDSGNYTCQVDITGFLPRSQTITITVEESKASFVNMSVENDIMTVDEGNNATWRFSVTNFPPNLKHQVTAPASDSVHKYVHQSFRNGTYIFTILNATLSDFGMYNLTLTTPDGLASNHSILKLEVRSEPKLEVTGVDDLIMVETEVVAKCIQKGYPLEPIRWLYQPCPPGICQSSFRNQKDAVITNDDEGDRENVLNSVITFTAKEPAYLRCTAGSANKDIPIRVSDIDKEYTFTYKSKDSPREVSDGSSVSTVETDSFELVCCASKFDFSNLTLDVDLRNNDEGALLADITDFSTEFSYKKKLVVSNVTKEARGIYSCTAVSGQNEIRRAHMKITVEDLLPVYFVPGSNMLKEDHTVTKYAKESFTFQCLVNGTGEIAVYWTKDEEPLPDNFGMTDDLQQTIMITDLNAEQHSGKYQCKASNRDGKYWVEGFLTLKVEGEVFSLAAKAILGIVACGIVVLLLIVLFLCRRVKIDRKSRRETKRNIAFLFEIGRPSELNPDCTADEQAEILPYDKKWEISRDRITLGQQLGSGAFGRVVKALVSNLEPGKDTSTVALKMCKSHADHTQIRALTLELKIMIHLGKHLNIVNLLGANTSRIGKGELWILVEYCHHGSLLNYLHRHRKSFVDVTHPVTGAIDFSNAHCMSPFSPKFPLSPAPSTSPKSVLDVFETGNAATTDANGMAEEARESAEKPMLPVINDGTEEKKSESPPRIFRFERPPKGMTMVDNPSYHQMPSATPPSCSSESDWHKFSVRKTSLKYSLVTVDSQGNLIYDKSTVPGVTSSFTTVDLVCWSWQVAEGMDYLTRRKVLHGDLAARNLLLSQDNVVKISDFGLSRDIYKNDVYMKKTNDVMPLKWMSIEAIRDQVFTVESDVWAFGVTLWEIFTLGGCPYPGMNPDRSFLESLVGGHRMEKPKYGNDEIYQLLLKCWCVEPDDRPGFRYLANTLSQMLMPETTRHYNDKNNLYKNLNEERFKTETDYLEMLSSPEYKNLCKKDLVLDEGEATNIHYIDMAIKGSSPTPDSKGTSPLPEPVPGYLPMSSCRGSPPPKLGSEARDTVNLQENSSAKEKENSEIDAMFRRSTSDEPSDVAFCLRPSLPVDNEAGDKTVSNSTPQEDAKDQDDGRLSPSTTDAKEADATSKGDPLILKDTNYVNLPPVLFDDGSTDKSRLIANPKDVNYVNLNMV